MKILVIDDERAFARALCRYLERKGFTTALAYTAREGLRLVQEMAPDVALVDMRLPDMDGIEVCRRLRKAGDILLIALSAYEHDHMVEATELAADLWLPKPVRMRELESRIQALLRRHQAETSPVRQSRLHTYHDGTLYLDGIQRLAKSGDRRIDLSAKEWDLLICLLERRNQVISREELLERLWAPDQVHRGQYLAQYINRLRQKLEPDSSNPRYIRTVRGRGYWFCTQDVNKPIGGLGRPPTMPT
jgi:two-component system, OmpR family, alkaline phosphatase synthesis response regulator PhoP